MSANSHDSTWTGWRLVGVTAVVLAIGLLIVCWAAANDIEAARAAIRYTARVSVTLFLLAFGASAAWQLWPSVFTRWQRQNRRYLGVSFALSHFIHLGAILSLGLIDAETLRALTQPASWILGGLAYLFIAAMAATSFDRSARLIGPTAWKWLHTIGSYYVWLVFANSYISRALQMPEYIVPAVAVVTALALRIAAAVQRRRTTALAVGSRA